MSEDCFFFSECFLVFDITQQKAYFELSLPVIATLKIHTVICGFYQYSVANQIRKLLICL